MRNRGSKKNGQNHLRYGTAKNRTCCPPNTQSRISWDSPRISASLLSGAFRAYSRLSSINCARIYIDGLQVLDDISARLSMLHSKATCIRTDHYGICKFSSESSPGFDLVCAVIQGFVSRAPGWINYRWKDEERKMLLGNRNSALSKPLNIDEDLLLGSRRNCYRRQEYGPSVDYRNVQIPTSRATAIQAAENEVPNVLGPSFELVNEAGLEDYDHLQELSSNDPHRLPPQVTSHEYGVAMNKSVSPCTTSRETVAFSGVDNINLEAGKPRAFTTQISEVPGSHQAFPLTKTRTIFTPGDENGTFLGRHWSPESNGNQSGGWANARPHDPRISTSDHARQSANAFAYQAPASKVEQELHLKNKQPITFVSGHGPHDESDTPLNGRGSSFKTTPAAEDRVSFPGHSQMYSRRELPSTLVVPSSYNLCNNDNDGSAFEAPHVQQAYSIDSHLCQPSSVDTWTGYTISKDVRSRVDDIEPSPQVNQDRIIADILAPAGNSPSEEGKTMEHEGMMFQDTGAAPNPSSQRLRIQRVKPPQVESTLNPVRASGVEIQAQPCLPHLRLAPSNTNARCRPRLLRLQKQDERSGRDSGTSRNMLMNQEVPRVQDHEREETNSRNCENWEDFSVFAPELNQSPSYHPPASIRPTLYSPSEIPIFTSRSFRKRRRPSPEPKEVVNHPKPKRAKTTRAAASPPTISAAAPSLQELDPTQEELAKAKEEVLKMLREWTTVDVSTFIKRDKDSTGGVEIGGQASGVVC